MHIPDGFLNGGASLGGGAVAVGGVAYSLRQARDVLAERAVALAGLVAAYVFAAQMVNFPVAAGTSGHLLGGVLAAVLVGPYVGAVCVAVVLVVQALVFADGGLSTLGLNIVNMALIGSIGGYLIFRSVRALLGRTRRSVLVATAVAAWSGPVLASLAFVGEYSIGGNRAVSTGSVLWAMVGVHSLIGVGEAVITTLTVAAVLTSRPDLVHGAKGLDLDAPSQVGRRSVKAVFAVGAVAAALIAAGASPFASSSPDGLEKVAADKGIDVAARDSAAADSPVADYSVNGVDNDNVSTALAGLVGVAITLGAGGLIFALVRRRRAVPAAVAAVGSVVGSVAPPTERSTSAVDEPVTANAN